MTKETFKKILELQSAHYQKECKLYELGIDLTETNENIIGAVELLWDQILTKAGSEWLSWYLYQKHGISGEPREDLKAWDEKGNEIVKNVDELYDYLLENEYFKI